MDSANGTHAVMVAKRATVTVVTARIRLPYTDLVNEVHLENWASKNDSPQPVRLHARV